MKNNHSRILRSLYIVLVPVVLLTILLNSGWLQHLLVAVSVHGETYSVVRYNFYYFDVLNTFLEENADILDELSYDPGQSAGKQIRADGMTWKAWFQQQAEANLSQTAYYCDLAQTANYVFSEAELAPVEETLARQVEQRALYNISAGNYYRSYYGAGMDQDTFTQELKRRVQAQAYREHQIANAQPSQSDIDLWLAQHPMADYRTADLRVITLTALPDRETGETGPDQLTALSAKLDRLAERYESGANFADLQAAFSTLALGDEAGVLTGTTAADLPAVLADWCLTDQERLSEGETFSVVDYDNGIAYFVMLDSLGSSGPEAEAAAVLRTEIVDRLETEAFPDYQVVRNNFTGFHLTGA